MTTNILANINVNSAAACEVGWANITDMAVSGITVQGTDSVLLLMFQAQINPATDQCCEFQFYVNGSSTGSPVTTAWTDTASGDEAQGATLVWAITGLSGSANSFSVQWKRIQSACLMDTTRNRTFQILEIVGGDAEILVNQSVSGKIGDPATWEDLFTASDITVQGTSSVLIMIANVPFTLEADESTDLQFAVDASREGAITRFYTDETDGGNGWCGVHVLDGLSTGTHSFHLQWQTISGAGQTRAFLRTFQVVEITVNATLELELVSSVPGSAPGSYGDVNGLSDSYVVNGTDAIALIFANIQIVAAVDRVAEFSVGIDSVEEGAQVLSFTDSTAIAGYICLARAKTGLSNASHTFAARWDAIQGTPTLDEARPRSLFVIEFLQAPVVTYKLEGITKNNVGSVLGDCECYLVKDNLDDTYTFIAYQLSNSGTGVYSFTGLADNDANYQVIAWKDGTPVMDVTDKVLVPVEE